MTEMRTSELHEGPPMAEAMTQAVTGALTRVLAETQAQGRLPSLSAAIAVNGEVVWADAVGSIDGRAGGVSPSSATQYRMGSITKTFVAVAIMRLRDEGLLGLGDRLGKHLGSAVGELSEVTIAQLLSHTSGLAAETDGQWWERTAGGDWASLRTSLRLVHEPGERFHYSNVGFGVLGQVLAVLRERPWFEVVEKELITPLGLRRTSFQADSDAAPGWGVHPLADVLQPEPSHDAGAMAPAGQLWSTPSDLVRWGELLRSGADGVLAEHTAHQLRRPRGVHDDRGMAWTGAHGLGIEVLNLDGRRFVGHGGSMPGFLAHLMVDVLDGVAVAATINATSGVKPSAVTTRLHQVFADLAPRPVTPWSADASQLAELDLTGPWYWGTAAHQLHARPDGALELTVPGHGRPDRFEPIGTDRWRGLDGYFAGEELRVHRRDGRVAYLEIASFRFTSTPYAADCDTPGGVQNWQ